MAPLKEIDPYESPLAFFGNEVRQHRLRLGLSQPKLSRRLFRSDDLISKIETGKATPTLEFASDCDEQFGTHGSMYRLATMVRRLAAYPAWLRPFVEAERVAHTLRNWQPILIPGLLQTEEYARGLINEWPGLTEERREELLKARMERQSILNNSEPPAMWFVFAENVLHYEVGDRKVMFEQLSHLIQMSRHTHVNLQVVPSGSKAHAGMTGAFVVATTGGSPDVLYLESVHQGHVSDRPEDIAAVINIWEAIRSEALPFRTSLELITKVMETRWKAQI
jgi:transcriptional regulator with XRE-family HTH domain